jgi:hypothetical protein
MTTKLGRLRPKTSPLTCILHASTQVIDTRINPIDVLSLYGKHWSEQAYS